MSEQRRRQRAARALRLAAIEISLCGAQADSRAERSLYELARRGIEQIRGWILAP